MTADDFAFLKLLIERQSYMNTYWNFLIGVSSALIGIMASGHSFTKTRALKTIFVFIFTIFAFSNYGAINSLVEQRHALLHQLSSDFPTDLKSSLQPKSNIEYVAFHVIIDLLVIICILFVPWHLLRKK